MKQRNRHLQLVGEMHNLVVNSQLLSVVSDDQDADRSTSLSESFSEFVVKVSLVDNLEALLDLTRLSHGDELTVIADIDEAVLLEDRSEEGVEDNRRRWMRDNTWLFMELLGEEVDTEVTMLTSLGRGGDADDLAWAALEDHKITNADVVAWDCEGVVCLVDRGYMGGGRGLELLVWLVRLNVGVGVVILVVFASCHFGSGKEFAVGRDFF
jgi:hypothetical protein